MERGGGRLDDYGRIEVIVCRLESRRRDVTERYYDWFRIGLALASIFGEGGTRILSSNFAVLSTL